MGIVKGMPEREGEIVSSRREGFPRWGFALIAFLALMFGANGWMVWLSSRGHRDLVRADYYDAGLDQDAVIARNGLARAPGMDVAFHRGAKTWRAESGSALLRNAVCKVGLYRPDDGREDKILNLGARQAVAGSQDRNVWSGPSPSLRKGFWVARLVWEQDGKPIMEESFRIYSDG
jgi:FixH protein